MKRILLFLLVPIVFICSSAKVMAANLYLSNLTVTGYTLSPIIFTQINFNYSLAVSSGVTSIPVVPTQSVGGSTIKINGTTVASGATDNVTLTPGVNTISIVVTKGGNTTETYTLTVTRESISYAGTPFSYYTGLPISTASSAEVGDNPLTYSASGLPAGLSINALTGDITGTPSAVTAATNYTITAGYGGGVTATATVNMTVLASTISYAGTPFTYYTGLPISTASSTEVGGNPTSYSASGLPAGLTLNTSTGDITGTPSAVSAAANYTITANYSAGPSATTTINIKVLASTISYAGSPFTYYTGLPILTASVTKTGGTPTSYSGALPAGLTLNASTGDITGTPSAVSAATNYTITANYSVGPSTTTTVNIKVLASAISYAGSPFTYNAGTPISTASVTKTGGTPTSYSGILPTGLTLNTSTGDITGTPTVASAATNYTITANYSVGPAATTTISIKVLAPTINYSGSPFTYYAGASIATASSTTANGTPTSYSGTLPAGLLLNTSTGNITGTPTTPSAAANYTITATYGSGVTATTPVNITVLAQTISYSGSPYTFYSFVAIPTVTPTATGSPSGYSINTPLPSGLSFNTSTGVITGTPTVVTSATPYTITANYAAGVTASYTITVTVNVGPPILAYTPSTNTYMVGTAITPLTPSNTGGASTSFIIGPALPAGLSFDNSTGTISGTPTVASATTIYTVIASNSGGSAGTTVTITVNPKPPVISYTPSATIDTVGKAIITLTPTNTGGAATSYSINTPLPAGLSFNTTTGVISGTPIAISALKTYTITATNAGGSGSTTETITVNPVAPSITYTPSTNIYNPGVTITPLTPVNTGGPVDYYIIGPALPDGLTFNTTTGVISGTPISAWPVTTYAISANNDGGVGTATITLSVVIPLPPVISYTPSTNTYIAGTAIAPLTPASTGGTVATYSINIALPAGLSLNTTTGVISGTPTAVSPTTTYTITGTNGYGSATTTITLTVKPALPAFTYSPSTNVYTVAVPISALTPNNTGGPVTSYSISAALPAGLSFNTTTGVISGTPTGTSAVKTYTITGTNASGTGTTTVTISVTNTAPSISYVPGTVLYIVGTAITPAVPTNTGGGSVTYSLTGTLPAGLTFDPSTGIISGTPTVPLSTTSFTIKATNTAGNSSTTLSITVSPSAPVISYIPSTNAYRVGAAITPLTPVNTGGAVAGYSYATTGIQLTGANLSTPSLMAIDPAGNIYTTNYGNGTISRWNSSNVYLGTFGTGLPNPLLAGYNPEAIVFDAAGNAYVEDEGNGGRIYKFNSSGAYQSTIITGLGTPFGLAITPAGNLLIATYSGPTSHIYQYTTGGTLLNSFTSGTMNDAVDVAVDASGNFYVANHGGGNVTKYSSTGVYLGVFGSGYSGPYVVTVDAIGNVYVGDTGNNIIDIYSSTGVLLNVIHTGGRVDGFVADVNGNLYVSNITGAGSVYEFKATGGYSIDKALPPGLTFNPTNGQITGTPTAVFPSTTYTITAYNTSGSGSTAVTLSCYQTFDWVGTTSTDWNTPSNWASGVVPTTAQIAVIGVNQTFNFYPNVSASDGIVNVGGIQFGNLGGRAPGAIVNTGGTLNVVGAITYQSDASSGLGYTATLSGAGILNANSISIISNTDPGGSYTSTLASSVANLNVAANISLTSSNSGANIFKSAFNVTSGITQLTGVIQTTNTSTSSSTIAVVPASTATLQILNTTALSGLSLTGTNIISFGNTGATVEYAGAAQTVYTDASITGLSTGVSYQNITFSGTGIKTVSTGNLNIAGDFTNNLVNDAANYINLISSNTNFTGTTQNLAAGAGNGTSFNVVNFSGAGTKTMVSGQFYVASTGVLSMLGTNANTILNANGLLTLNSDASSSATVAAIKTGPSITGNVNVQRYITGGPGYRGYRTTSSPVYAGTVGSNKVISVNYLKNNIYFKGISGPAAGFDAAGNPTVYLFRQDLTPSNTSFISGNWWGIDAINNSPSYNYTVVGQTASGTYNIPVGNGFLFFFRGDKTAASITTESQATYVPVAVTLTATGTLTQGQVIVSNWNTPASTNLAFTGSGTGTNYTVRGFNLLGNPYASSIDWETLNFSTQTSGLYGNFITQTVYEYNAATGNYDTYQQGGTYTNHGRRIIASGQGFFVVATNPTLAKFIFNESAKTTVQNTGLNLLMSTSKDMPGITNTNVESHLRLQFALDSINTDDTYIGFKSGASAKYADTEDAPYKMGSGKVGLSSFSSDTVAMAINRVPLLGSRQLIIPLNVSVLAVGSYKLNMTEIEAVPQLYQVWLKDAYKKDSVNMRTTPVYSFDIVNDTNSYGSHRFSLVLRQDTTLAVHLLTFTASKTPDGSQIAWTAVNEQNYTNFTVQRSTDGGKTYTVLGGFQSNGSGSYSFLDKNPGPGSNMYRLKTEDLNDTISYSKVVTLVYGNGSGASNNVFIFPNPAKSNLNLTIVPVSTATSNALYNIIIVNASGRIVKTATTSQINWQTNVSNLMPGTYVLQVVNSNDSSLVGKGTFVKL